MDASSECYLLVCAIEFGATYSGYAYSSISDYQNNPMNIIVPKWYSSLFFRRPLSNKTPSTLLLNKDKDFVAFGYEAETFYAQLADEGENEDYYYIKQFDFNFQDTLEKKEVKIRDITGKKEMLAINIFKHTIKYFRKLMLNTINGQNLDVKETNIRWVLAVPAIWSDKAKQLISEAAELAGIPKIKLKMMFKSEGASLYCSRLPLPKFVDGNDFGFYQIGQKFMVLDADRTVDITVHEVTDNKTFKVLEKARVLDCGAFCVNNRFKDILTDIVTPVVMEAFCMYHPEEYDNLFQDFESKMRTTKTTQQTWVTMRMPRSLRRMFTNLKKQLLEEEIRDSKYCKSIRCDPKHFSISPALFEHFFVSARTSISDHVYEMLENPQLNGTDTIIMIGGFSESPILQTYIKNRFPNCRIVIPNEPDLAVLKGSVLFGYNPCIISERKAKYWYGIASFTKFNPKFHNSEKKYKDLCCDIFDICVRKGSTLNVFEDQTKGPYETNREDQNEIDLDIYVSDSDTPPTYVTDEDCHYLGTLTVALPKENKTSQRNTRSVYVNFTFGGKEFFVHAKVNNNSYVTTVKFHFPGNEP
uniref:Heat shock 70 kDa protein 12A-like isoform X3 n=1 Tax=Crassostrea virginica TaxID=6565 RepID=A0A8B8D103_CRAVI|nr:heat shock 70 kDa protein 12A-like isoform X3 [Crassostrea virginica]